MNKRYLNVAYEDRDLAKRLGAVWDPSVRKWYCRKGSQLDRIFSWRSVQRQSVSTDQLPQQHVAKKRLEADLPLFA